MLLFGTDAPSPLDARSIFHTTRGLGLVKGPMLTLVNDDKGLYRDPHPTEVVTAGASPSVGSLQSHWIWGISVRCMPKLGKGARLAGNLTGVPEI